MTNELNLNNELSIGDIVGSTKRMVIASTKIGDRIPDDSYANWITICCGLNDLHPYVVWNADSEGNCWRGDYCTTLMYASARFFERSGASA